MINKLALVDVNGIIYSYDVQNKIYQRVLDAESISTVRWRRRPSSSTKCLVSGYRMNSLALVDMQRQFCEIVRRK